MEKNKYPNAWTKNINQDYPDSGFVRIWGKITYDVKESELEDLLAVATYKL